MSAVKENLDQPKFNEAINEWLSCENELAPDLHSMTTSLSPPDVDSTTRLYTEHSGTQHRGFGDHRLLRGTHFAKDYTEQTQNRSANLMDADGAEPQKHYPNNPFLPQLDIPIQPSSVVNPKYLTGSLEANSSKPCVSGGAASPPIPRRDNLSITERSAELSTAVRNSAYVYPGFSDFSLHLGQSIGTVVLGSDTVHSTGMSPLSAHVPFAGPAVYKYGNDASFVRNGFYTPSFQTSDRENTGYSPNFLDCLERQNNISSPRLEGHVTMPELQLGSSDLDDLVCSDPIPVDGSEVKGTRLEGRSRRRNKTKSKDKASFHLEQDQLQHPQRSRKHSTSKGSSLPPSGTYEEFHLSSNSHQSTKPSKPSRQNLSSEQRRANHIGSEKQRRDTIQGLEDELRKIVPVLRSSVFSKAEILEEAGKWLESLIEGNRSLEARLGKNKG